MFVDEDNLSQNNYHHNSMVEICLDPKSKDLDRVFRNIFTAIDEVTCASPDAKLKSITADLRSTTVKFTSKRRIIQIIF